MDVAGVGGKEKLLCSGVSVQILLEVFSGGEFQADWATS